MKSVSVLSHVRMLIRELDRRLEQRFAATEQAIRKAEDATEKRLHALNELRADVAPKSEIKAVREIVDDMKSRIDRMEGRSTGLGAGWSILLAVVSAAGIVVAILATLNK